MPTVNGKEYPYTKAGIAAAEAAKRDKGATPAGKTKGRPIKGGYNITRNIGY